MVAPPTTTPKTVINFALQKTRRQKLNFARPRYSSPTFNADDPVPTLAADTFKRLFTSPPPWVVVVDIFLGQRVRPPPPPFPRRVAESRQRFYAFRWKKFNLVPRLSLFLQCPTHPLCTTGGGGYVTLELIYGSSRPTPRSPGIFGSPLVTIKAHLFLYLPINGNLPTHTHTHTRTATAIRLSHASVPSSPFGFGIPAGCCCSALHIYRNDN